MKTGIVAIGNTLMGDDGFGAAVLQGLQESFELPAGVEVLDLGTPGLGMVDHLRGFEALVIVDAVRAEGAPGTLLRFSWTDLGAIPRALMVGPHDGGLLEALWTLELVSEQPRVLVLIGVIPQTLQTGLELSAPVRDAVPRAVRAVLDEIESLGLGERGR